MAKRAFQKSGQPIADQRRDIMRTAGAKPSPVNCLGCGQRVAVTIVAVALAHPVPVHDTFHRP